jgi:hypothetical protein
MPGEADVIARLMAQIEVSRNVVAKLESESPILDEAKRQLRLLVFILEGPSPSAHRP